MFADVAYYFYVLWHASATSTHLPKRASYTYYFHVFNRDVTHFSETFYLNYAPIIVFIKIKLRIDNKSTQKFLINQDISETSKHMYE